MQTAILTKMRYIVRQELNIVTKCISSDLLKDIKEIGSRRAALESRADDTTTVLDGHGADIAFLQEEVCTLKDKLEELENPTGWSNIQIRGLLESITDLYGTVTALFQELALNLLLALSGVINLLSTWTDEYFTRNKHSFSLPSKLWDTYKLDLRGHIIQLSGHRRREREMQVLSLEKELSDTSETLKHNPTSPNQAVVEIVCTALDLALTYMAERSCRGLNKSTAPREINQTPHSHVNSISGTQYFPPIKL